MDKKKRKEEKDFRNEGADRVEKGKSFEQKTGEIFRLMGYEVEYNRKIAGNQIDVIIKKKEKITKKHKYFICECKYWKQNVGIDVVKNSFNVKESVKQELKIKDCDAIIVTSGGFTPEAVSAAQSYDITLHTYNDLLSELMDFDKYLTNLIHTFESSPLYDLYIEQDFFPEKENKEINSFEFVQKWLTKTDRKQFSLLGDYGTGKTSFARKLAYNMAKEYKEKPGSVRIPFFVDLRQSQKALSLHTLILEQLKNAGVEPVNADIFLKLLAEGKILLIFDAFDEMATMSSAEITLNNFRQLNQAVIGEAKVILTSRTHYFRDKYEVDRILKKQGVEGLTQHATMLLREVYDKSEYEIVYLKEFTPHQVKEYLKKALKDNWKDAHDKIKSIYNLEDLSHRPVLLDMIVKTLPKIDMKGKDEFNVVHLYEVYTFSWIERDDHRFQIIKEGKEELVEGLACKLWQEGQKSIHYTALSDVLSRHLKSKIKTTRELEAADFEVRTAAFLVRDGEGNYSFAHRSFQEFFIARKIKKELLKGNTKILDLRRLSREIIFFLRHLMENDNQIIQPMAELLAKAYKKNISENALLSFYNVIKMGCLDQRFSLNEEVEFSDKDAKNFQNCLKQHLSHQFKLSTAALNSTTLSWMIFKHADFRKTSVENSLLMHCIFEDVKFSQTDLKNIDFSNSIFRNVKFEKADARYCDFKSCVFINCTFKQSDFSMSNFMNTGFHALSGEDNDFTGCGFLRSNINFNNLEKSLLFGIGKPNTIISELTPLLRVGHHFAVNSVAVSTDGKWLISGSFDNTLKLWNIEQGRLVKSFNQHKSSITAVAFSSDNCKIVSASYDKTIKLWNVERGHLIKTLEGRDDYVTCIAVSTDNRRIISGSYDRTLKLWDLETGQLLKTLEGHNRAVTTVSISRDNKFIASGSMDNTIKWWDADSGQLIKTFEGHLTRVTSVAISRDNRWIVSGGDDHTVKIRDVQRNCLFKTLEGHQGCVNSVCINNDNHWIVSASEDDFIKIWEIETGNLLKSFESHANGINSVAITPDNRRIISGSNDNAVQIWDVKTGLLVKTFEGYSNDVHFVSIGEDNRRITSIGYDNTIRWWDVETGFMQRIIFENYKQGFIPKAVSPDNLQALSTSSDNTMELWDIRDKTPKLLKAFEQEEGRPLRMTSAAFSRDGKWIAAASRDKTIKLWDIKKGYLLKRFEGHQDEATAVAFTPDSQRIVSASLDFTIRIWDIENLQPLRVFQGHERGVITVTVSPDNRHVVSGSADNTIKLWDIESGDLLQTFNGHLAPVRTSAVCPDNRHLVSGSDDNTLKMWDMETGQLVNTFAGHHHRVTSVSISTDNRWLVSGSWDNTIRLWDMKSGESIYTVILLPGSDAVVMDKNNRFILSEPVMQRLYYTDGLALYPASELEE